MYVMKCWWSESVRDREEQEWRKKKPKESEGTKSDRGKERRRRDWWGTEMRWNEDANDGSWEEKKRPCWERNCRRAIRERGTRVRTSPTSVSSVNCRLFLPFLYASFLYGRLLTSPTCSLSLHTSLLNFYEVCSFAYHVLLSFLLMLFSTSYTSYAHQIISGIEKV